MTDYSIVPVHLGSTSYEILIGNSILQSAAEILREKLGRRQVLVVTDDCIAGLYLEPLQRSLDAADMSCESIVLPAGEASKDFIHLEWLIKEMLKAGIARDSIVIALGGGVVGDLAGFAASIILRGVDCVQMPTTLLSQVDSSVGGKTGINTQHGKNLVGTFHQPTLVIADTEVLGSLPRREFLAGYAEVVKYSLLSDADFFRWLEDNAQNLIDGDALALRRAVTKCCEIKAKIVGEDERESGRRLLLNLGHTFGHAFEADLGFDARMLHGEAVAIGMVFAFDLSCRLGYCSETEFHQVRAHFEAVGLPTKLPNLSGHSWSAERLLLHMAQDKKIRDGRQVLILADAIGNAFVNNQVTKSDLLQLMEAYVDG